MDHRSEVDVLIRHRVAEYLASVPVPPFPQEEVRRQLASTRVPARPRPGLRAAAAAGVAALALATAAFAVPEVRVLVHQGAQQGAQAVALDVAEARAREAGFTVIRPAGLPTDARLVRVETLGGDGVPLMVTFRYARASGAEFAIVEARAGPLLPAEPARTFSMNGSRVRLGPERAEEPGAAPPSWVVGGTRVTVLHAGSLSPEEVESIRAAMGGR